MALTTDTIDKAKALLDEGAQRFQDYQSDFRAYRPSVS
jgi:hypothetical protein